MLLIDIPNNMHCESCSAPALYLCKCANSRLCSHCFDQHCQGDTGEHQLVLIEEAEPTYTAAELFAAPGLVTEKIDWELGRLEGFRRNVLQLMETAREEFRRMIREKAKEWKEKSKPEFEVQTGKLREACEVLKGRKMIEGLPKEGFPWKKVADGVPKSVIELPGRMDTIDFSLEDLMQVAIEWDLQGYPIDGEQKEKHRAKGKIQAIVDQPDSPAGLNTSETRQSDDQSTSENWPSDPIDRFHCLKTSEKLREKYLIEKLSSEEQWSLRRFLPSFEEVRDLDSLNVSSLSTTADYSDLATIVVYCGELRSLTVKSSFSTLSDFSLLCEAIRLSRIQQLCFPLCKLTTSHTSLLVSNLPANLHTLDLSSNYFTIEPVAFGEALQLHTLIVHEVPATEQWLEIMLQCNPQIEVVLSNGVMLEDRLEEQPVIPPPETQTDEDET